MVEEIQGINSLHIPREYPKKSADEYHNMHSESMWINYKFKNSNSITAFLYWYDFIIPLTWRNYELLLCWHIVCK